MSEYEGDLEAAGRLIKAALESKAQEKKPKRKQKESAHGATETDAIVREMKGLGIGSSDLSIAYRPSGSDMHVEVPPITLFPVIRELRWTERLPGFDTARQSAINGTLRILAETQALRCSFGAESPHIEQTLFQIRAGLIPVDDPKIANLMAYAQRIGNGRAIAQRIADAMHDAERRKNNGTALPDLNQFRLTLAHFWTGFLFWLMSDSNIAAFIPANIDPSLICNPSSITKARNELGLIKSERLLVKGVGPNFVWTFLEGYPPIG